MGREYILTDKAKEDFIKSYGNIIKVTIEDYDAEFEVFTKFYSEIHQYASIIDFFDSVGIYIEIQIHQILRGVNMWRGKINNCVYDDLEYKSNRQQSTEQAILKANEIYNELPRKS